jgi:hypothetical protein
MLTLTGDDYLFGCNQSPMWIEMQDSYFAVLGATKEKRKDAMSVLFRFISDSDELIHEA